MVIRIYEGYEYTDLLDAIQDTVINNFPDFNVHIARGKYPFVSVDVTKNANRNIVGRPRDRFVIRPEANGKITLTCDTCNSYDAEILDLQGIVNYFNDYLSDFTAVESIKRNKRRMKEGLSHSLEVKLQDFAQEYGEITYDDITKLGSCWDSLDASDKKEIQKLVSDVRKACKEAGMDAGELSSEYPEDKKTCDSLVKAVKGVCKSTKIKEARIGRTKEVKVLQGNWGYGWDDLGEYDKYDNGECKADLKAYRENDPTASYRVIFRRVPNKDYVEK